MHRKLSQLSGIVFVALVLAAVVGIGGSTPGTDASAEKLATFYSDNTVRQSIAAFVIAAAVPFVVLFGVGLATSLGPREGGVSGWGYVLLVGTALVAGAGCLVAFTHFALASAADDGISGTALQALNALDGNNWVLFNPAFGVMMLGAAGALLSAGVLRWLGWVALVLGLALFVPYADFFALLGTLLWIVVSSVALARGPVARYSATPQAA